LLEEKFIIIGKLVKTVGLKGYLKAIILTDFPDKFGKLKSIKLFSEYDNKVLKNITSGKDDFDICDVIYEKDYIKILFEGFDNVELAGGLTGNFIVIEESKRNKLDKGKYYYYELIGLDVKSNDEVIGIVKSIENYGGQDLFNVKLNKSKKEILVPFIEEFIKKIDISNKTIDVEIIEGMLE
jgi:16S rRNA processing protein RimM